MGPAEERGGMRPDCEPAGDWGSLALCLLTGGARGAPFVAARSEE